MDYDRINFIFMTHFIPKQFIRYPSKLAMANFLRVRLQGWLIKGHTLVFNHSNTKEMASLLINSRKRPKRQINVVAPLKDVSQKGYRDMCKVI
jgi:hypothetical protein